jgi:hypothetical protein
VELDVEIAVGGSSDIRLQRELAPSTRSVTPVIYEAPGLNKKTTAAETSDSVPYLPIGLNLFQTNFLNVVFELRTISRLLFERKLCTPFSMSSMSWYCTFSG